jgi:hypothetical protein
MYSRSYGSIETDRKNDGISIPANYNGSRYPSGTVTAEATKKSEPPPQKEEVPTLEPLPETAPVPQQSAVGSLLEKFTAEDIILFVLVFSLLREESGDPSTILAVILALLLL